MISRRRQHGDFSSPQGQDMICAITSPQLVCCVCRIAYPSFYGSLLPYLAQYGESRQRHQVGVEHAMVACVRPPGTACSSLPAKAVVVRWVPGRRPAIPLQVR